MSSSNSTLFLFALFIIVFILIVVVTVFVVNRQKKLIRQFLESRNAKAVRIVWKPLGSYWVEYEDSKGQRTGKRCKILAGSTIAWIEYL